MGGHLGCRIYKLLSLAVFSLWSLRRIALAGLHWQLLTHQACVWGRHPKRGALILAMPLRKQDTKRSGELKRVEDTVHHTISN